MNLAQDDERTYWGKISEVETGQDPDNSPSALKESKFKGAIMSGTYGSGTMFHRKISNDRKGRWYNNADGGDFDQEQGYLGMDPEGINEYAKWFNFFVTSFEWILAFDAG